MKKFGLIGGLGPASTIDYYNEIIKGYMAKTSIDNYPEIIINSINMTEIISTIEKNDLNRLANILAQAVNVLNNAGANFAAIASNTPHIVFDKVSSQSSLPLISIVAETCKFAKSKAYKKVFIIGTLFTMRSDMYTNAFREYGILADVPSEKEQEEIYSLFYPNLENGIVISEDKERMLNLLREILSERKYDALVLGRTELPLMIKTNDLDIPLINTTQIHINSIVDYLVDNRTL